MYNLSDYDYFLPRSLIAQHPVAGRRDRSRLMRLDKSAGAITHHRFDKIAALLSPTDLLVVNDTAVVPARLIGKKPTGGRVEVFVLDYPGLVNSACRGEAVSECLIKAAKAPGTGTRFVFEGGLSGEVLDRAGATFRVRFSGSDDIDRTLHEIGRIPLPPYIRRTDADSPAEDRSAYQTVYARKKGAVAAPTAGLHFTRSLLDRIRQRGIPVLEITLHVGYGTFVPVKAADIRAHRMHAESYRISAAVADRITRHKRAGGRIVAVGTTCVRSLEHAAGENGTLQAGAGSCDLFIYPGYRFKMVDALITNFHLPRSTLLMLVSALAGRERILAAYKEAVREKYRFYSYGDAMLIE